jgi:hypothetical protein
VPQGTAVEAFLEGVKGAETTVTAQSTYELLVPGGYDDDGKMVSFTVAGVQASQTAAWASGELNHNLSDYFGTPERKWVPVPIALLRRHSSLRY